MSLYCDNKAKISIAHDPIQYDRIKHIGMDHHFINKQLQCGYICTPFINTRDQLADILTKGLSGPSFSKVVSKLRMIDIYSLA